MLFILYIIVDANISESLETIGQESSLGNIYDVILYIYDVLIYIHKDNLNNLHCLFQYLYSNQDHSDHSYISDTY